MLVHARTNNGADWDGLRTTEPYWLVGYWLPECVPAGPTSSLHQSSVAPSLGESTGLVCVDAIDVVRDPILEHGMGSTEGQRLVEE